MTKTLDRRKNTSVDARHSEPPPQRVLPEPSHRSPSAAVPAVEVVVPVYNESQTLRRKVEELHSFLSDSFPVAWRITVADNASTDETLEVARRAAGELDRVKVIHLDEKGRGRALRRAWLESQAAVVAYMDVDLSTDLSALLPLVAPLLSGHSDLAIGSRLAKGARVRRIPKREVISRGYNLIVHAALGARFTDAQCGFKAVRREVLAPLLEKVENDNWFFDTELLALAERSGLRIHEVPVDWTDDPDSRVHIGATALEDLRGIASVRRRIRAGSFRAEIPAEQQHPMGALPLAVRIVRFCTVGVISTALFALFYLTMRNFVSSAMASASSLAATTVINTALNRRYTFAAGGDGRPVRDQIEAGLVFLLALALTTAATKGLDHFHPGAGRATELAVLVSACLAATVLRFIALSLWVFRHPSIEVLDSGPTAFEPSPPRGA